MKEIARVYLSSNGKEFLVYDGNDELVTVLSANGSENLLGEYVQIAIARTVNESE